LKRRATTHQLPFERQQSPGESRSSSEYRDAFSGSFAAVIEPRQGVSGAAKRAVVEIVEPPFCKTAQICKTKFGSMSRVLPTQAASKWHLSDRVHSVRGINHRKDSTLNGSRFSHTLSGGFCHDNGLCTNLESQVGTLYTDRPSADPSNDDDINPL
jgi:hypothetical protein